MIKKPWLQERLNTPITSTAILSNLTELECCSVLSLLYFLPPSKASKSGTQKTISTQNIKFQIKVTLSLLKEIWSPSEIIFKWLRR